MAVKRKTIHNLAWQKLVLIGVTSINSPKFASERTSDLLIGKYVPYITLKKTNNFNINRILHRKTSKYLQCGNYPSQQKTHAVKCL